MSRPLTRFTGLQRLLHWVMAVCIVAMLFIGIGMVSTTAPRYVRYEHAPGPPMEEFAHLIGHGSYELAFRDPALYAWLLGQSCRKCDRPLPPWRPLAAYENDGGGNGASRRKFGRPE